MVIMHFFVQDGGTLLLIFSYLGLDDGTMAVEIEIK